MAREYRIKVVSRGDGSKEYIIQYRASFLWWSWWANHTVTDMCGTYLSSFMHRDKARAEVAQLQVADRSTIITKVEYEEV